MSKPLRWWLVLIILLLWVGNGWAQPSIEAKSEPKIAPLIEKLTDPDLRIRRSAAEDLVTIGSVAVPSLLEALKNPDQDLRWRVASVLGDLGAEAAAAVPALTTALQDEDGQVRLFATLALGNIGSAAKSAVPALMKVLNDPDQYVRIYAPTALRKMGVEAKVAVPALIKALQDPNPRVRLNAAYALGSIGREAVTAIPDLIRLLEDEQSYVRVGAVKGLAGIAEGFQDTVKSLSSSKLKSLIATLEQVLTRLAEQPDTFSETEIARIRRPLSALQAEQEDRFFDQALTWLLQHPWILGLIGYGIGLPSLWLFLLRIAPLWLLQINNALQPYTDFSLPIIGIRVPLRYVLFVGWFHYHPQVLDAWVSRYLGSARVAFAQKDTVKARSGYVPLPVILEGVTIPQLSPKHLQPTFAKQRSCLVIWGEGGIGKTSLACQIAAWAMETNSPLCQHPMLPVLLEDEFRPIEGKSALIEAIRGQLQALIDEPDPIGEDLLIRLLRTQRILVIVDHFSELNAATQASLQPESPDFSVNALILTSRNEEKLGRINKTVIKPLRIETNQLSSFMEAYLMQRGVREHLSDQEFFDACTHLSKLMADRTITVLLAKLYAEQLAINQPQNTLPQSIPALMLSYINELNRDITTDPIDVRTLHRDAKVIGWECLKSTFQPTSAGREDILKALPDPETAATRLSYLEDRLHLIQTIGSAQDRIRFGLDPLAEYLAGLYVVDWLGTDQNRWQAVIFQPAEERIRAGGSIHEFLAAIRECYRCQIPAAQESDPVLQQLAHYSGDRSAQNY